MTNDTKPGKIHTHLDCIDGLRFAWSQKKKGFFANKLETYFVLMVRERDEVYDLLAKVEAERDNLQTTVDMDLVYLRKMEAERDDALATLAGIRAPRAPEESGR